MSTVVVVAVHPDDETLGCGGTLLRHKAQGDSIFWIIVTDMKEVNGLTPGQYNKRAAEVEAVASLYGFEEVFSFGFPATRLDEVPLGKIIAAISNIFTAIKPNIVYLPFWADAHSDHRITFKAALPCTKSFRYPSIRRVLMMETISETDFATGVGGQVFTPNVFLNVEGFIDKKLKIMEIYQSELGEHPFPRNIDCIRAQAMLRGATAGFHYAESFMMLKEAF